MEKIEKIEKSIEGRKKLQRNCEKISRYSFYFANVGVAGIVYLGAKTLLGGDIEAVRHIYELTSLEKIIDSTALALGVFGPTIGTFHGSCYYLFSKHFGSEVRNAESELEEVKVSS